MTLDDLVHAIRADRSQVHVFGKPITRLEMAKWFRRWPDHPLPDNLMTLLRRANGIHLCADPVTGRSYQGMAPLDEWRLARHAMWGPDAEPNSLDDRFLALSYHTDASSYVVLDVRRRKYFHMDSCGADETTPIGRSVEDLLSWLWAHRVP
jgi:hypothetical protein